MSHFKFNDENVLVSLDIGHSKFKALVCLKKSKTLEQVFFHEVPAAGLDNGRVVNVQEFLLAISSLLNECEDKTQRSFTEVYLGLSTKFYTLPSYGMTALFSREVQDKDVHLAIETAAAVPIPDKHICLHNKAQEFFVDGQGGILNPIGLTGLRLEVETQMLTIPKFYIDDMTKSLKMVGYTPKSFVHNTIAFGENLTTDLQKQEGVCVCDVGHRSTRLIYYHKGKILDIMSIPFGGHHFSLAISDKFKISSHEAQKIKEDFGTLQCHSVHDLDQVQSHEDGMFVSHKAIVELLEQSAVHLFTKIQEYTASKNFKNKINAGYVFTGSTCLLDGFLNMAQLYLGQSVFFPQFLSFQEKNFNKVNAWAIAQQSYFKNQSQQSKNTMASFSWTKLKDLF